MNNLATGVCACLQTGQRSCHDNDGSVIPCQGSGQDAEFCFGQAWPETRFSVQGELVTDGLTGLVWTQDANLAEFPCNWDEALEYIAAMNATEKFGFSDWRLPNRRELRSLISHQTRRPALPEGRSFSNVFASWYWSSTTAAKIRRICSGLCGAQATDWHVAGRPSVMIAQDRKSRARGQGRTANIAAVCHGRGRVLNRGRMRYWIGSLACYGLDQLILLMDR
jgi:hypothetical protein